MVLSAHKAAGGYLGNNISHVPTFGNLSIFFPLFLFGYLPCLTTLVVKEIAAAFCVPVSYKTIL